MIKAVARRAIRMLPAPAGFALLRRLSERTMPLRVTEAQQDALREARRMTYGARNRHAAWSWGEGPAVVFLHGWGGRAAQWAPAARQIAQRGFRTIAIDMTGHGESPARHARWAYFLDDIAELARGLDQPVHAWIGHSAGGLAVMTARRTHGIRAARYACVCAPSHPYPPIVVVDRTLNPPAPLLDRYRTYIAGQFRTDWSALESGAVFAGAGAELLLVYDATDRYLRPGDGDRIAALCPGARLLTLSGYGHQKIMAAPELVQAAGDFLAA